jgi:GNAT superfamily N-acetyltransferase
VPREEARTAVERRFGAGLGRAIASRFVRLSAFRCASLRPRLLPAAMIEIVPATADEYEAALGLLFNQLPSGEQKSSIADVLRALRRGRISQHGLLTARIEGAMVGSALFMLQSDRTAFVWPPAHTAEDPAPEVDDALLREIVCRIEKADAWIGQCLIERDRHEERETLSRNGFKHLTDLRFLVRRLDQPPAHPPTWALDGEPLETITYEPGINDARFARLIERTYLETRDCPELEGTRTGEQSLLSHRMSGEFDAARWKLFRWRGQDAGVLLMNDHPEQSSWEVVYLGVAQECRGNALGRRMLAQGLVAARAAQRCSVLLAVDTRNEYAGKVYDDLGFVETDRRAVHIYLPQRQNAQAANR